MVPPCSLVNVVHTIMGDCTSDVVPGSTRIHGWWRKMDGRREVWRRRRPWIVALVSSWPYNDSSDTTRAHFVVTRALKITAMIAFLEPSHGGAIGDMIEAKIRAFLGGTANDSGRLRITSVDEVSVVEQSPVAAFGHRSRHCQAKSQPENRPHGQIDYCSFRLLAKGEKQLQSPRSYTLVQIKI